MCRMIWRFLVDLWNVGNECPGLGPDQPCYYCDCPRIKERWRQR